ncbi:MAG: hypothetical protein ABI349_07115 [Casimicrobiaceae bacterium]
MMNHVVVRASAWGTNADVHIASFVENMRATLLFGLIIAFFARRTQFAT